MVGKALSMKVFSLVLMATLTLAAAEAAAQTAKIGVVNIARIEKESAVARSANDALIAEFEPRNRQIEEFQKKIMAAQGRFKEEEAKLSAAERQERAREIAGMMRQSDQMLRGLTEELELKRRELGVKIVQETREAIKTVAEAGKFDLILQEAAFARPAIDITDQVLKEMARRSGAR
jgi:outer membrane protein